MRDFIQKEKHLPAIPAAAEVLEEGIELGNMQAKLLEKVEELTLYMLQQDAELKALKAENAAMKLRLERLEEEETGK